MKRTALIEGCVLFLIGVCGLYGGLTSYVNRDARTQSSAMAPGMYVLFISVAVMLTALVYVFLTYKKVPRRTTSVNLDKAQAPWMSTNVICVVSAFAIYAYLIQWIGYVVPTIIFLLVEFRLLGVKSWKRNIVLTAIVVAIFYVVFIKYCEMVFPRGALLE